MSFTDGINTMDDHLYATCEVIGQWAASGSLHHLPVTYRLYGAEKVLVQTGNFAWWGFRAKGDGTYRQADWSDATGISKPSDIAVAQFSMAMTNSMRQRRARRDAIPQWSRYTSPIGLDVTTSRIVSHSRRGSLTWNNFEDFSTVESHALDSVSFTYEGTPMRIDSPWAMLIYAIALGTNFPDHPALLGGHWLPPGFEEYCTRSGRPLSFPDLRTQWAAFIRRAHKRA